MLLARHTAGLVGREAERELLVSALADRGCSGALISGIPGVGKTRLMREVLEGAASGGRPTAIASATDAGRGIPFGAFAPLIWSGEDPAGVSRAEALRRAHAAIAGYGGADRLVLGVDDAHLLDRASAVLVQQLAGAGTAFCVVTARSGEDLPDPILSLWKDDRLLHVELFALPREGADDLAVRLLGGPVEAEALEELWRVARGNPLFVTELVEGAVAAGALASDGGRWRIVRPIRAPGRLVDLVAARVAELDAPERQVMEHLAVAGTLPLGALLDLCRAAEVTRLERAGLIELSDSDDGDGPETSLGHPLYGELVLRAIPTSRRRSICRSLALVLDREGASPQQTVRAATIRLDAGLETDPTRLAAAARVAFGLLDSRLAERLARAALAAGDRFEALLVLGAALSAQGRHDEADDALSRAVTAARGDAELARAVGRRAMCLSTRMGRVEDAVASLEEALGQIQAPAWRAFCEADLAKARSMRGVLVDAPPLPEGEGEEWQLSRLNTAVISAYVHVMRGQLGQADAVLGRTLAASRAPAVRSAMPNAHDLLSISDTLRQALSGDLAGAAARAHLAYRTASAEHRDAAGSWGFLVAALALFRGMPADAREVALEAQRLLQRREFIGLSDAARAIVVAADSQLGSGEEARRALEALETEAGDLEPKARTFVAIARAWLEAVEGDLDAAAAAAVGHGSRAVEAGHVAFGAVAVHLAVRFGRPVEAAERLARCAELAEGELVAALAAHAAALRAHDGHALLASVERLSRCGLEVPAAEAAAQAAAVLRQAGSPAEAAQARSLARKLSAGHASTPALVGVESDLTPREAEIATLAADRLTSREISTLLGISVRTVDNHLRSAYRKLGLTNRRELSRVLGRARAGSVAEET